MYIMCVCFFSTLSHRVGALQISIIITIKLAALPSRIWFKFPFLFQSQGQPRVAHALGCVQWRGLALLWQQQSKKEFFFLLWQQQSKKEKILQCWVMFLVQLPWKPLILYI